jgi:predicted DNA binding protein
MTAVVLYVDTANNRCMQEIVFKIKHEGCPYGAISSRHPRMLMSLWCNSIMDVYDIKGESGELPTILKELRHLVRRSYAQVKSETIDESSGRITVVASSKVMRVANDSSVAVRIKRNHCLHVQPITYKGDWEYYRILSVEDGEMKGLFRDLKSLGETEIVLNKNVDGLMGRDIFTNSLTGLLADLTGKQLAALIDALEDGYYKVPRNVTVAKLAKAKGIPRTTYEEHLHKAESKVLRHIAPLLRLYAAS